MRRILLFLLITLLLCGCGKKDAPKAPDTQPTTVTPEEPEAPKEATEAVNIVSKETLVDLIRLNIIRSAQTQRAQYLGVLETMAKITVTDYTEGENVITATVTVSAPNMYAIAKEMEGQPFTNADTMDAAVCARLEKCSDFSEKTCQLTFRYVEEDWVVAFTEEFSDALYGGLITYRNEYLAAQEVQ